MNKLTISLLFISSSSLASPFLISDPYPTAIDPKPTHCGIYTDDNNIIEIPITTDSNGVYCKYDLENLQTGLHVFKGTHILKDSLWGTLESELSSPLSVIRPGDPEIPAGLRLEK